MAEVTRGIGALETSFRSVDGSPWIVMSGRTSFSASGAEASLEDFLQSGARRLVVEGPLPTTDEVDRLAAEVGSSRPRAILAVGGGLVIDTMKALALALSTGGSAQSLLNGSAVPSDVEIHTVAAPTTAGSGAERTPFAVLYHDGVKHSVDDPRLLPDHSIIDPALSSSAPRHVAASAALDALAHSVESMWACRSTVESIEVAAQALGQIVDNIETGVVGESAPARETLMYAASDAGSAIAVSRTTAAHALSYHLTARHGVPHGHAVALMLGRVIAFNGEVDESTVLDQRGLAHVASVAARISALLGIDEPVDAPERLRDLVASLGLAPRADEAAGAMVDRERWMTEVNEQRLGNNPRRINRDDLLAIVCDA
ncbi:MAG: iron-containing alcohol dehydrogenase [Actinomycetota bacterium]